MNERFVKVDIYSDESGLSKCYLGKAWCLLDNENCAQLLWSYSARVIEEFGGIMCYGGELGFHRCEEFTIVDCDDTNTPKHIWAKLAHCRLDLESYRAKYGKVDE